MPSDEEVQDNTESEADSDAESAAAENLDDVDFIQDDAQDNDEEDIEPMPAMDETLSRR